MGQVIHVPLSHTEKIANPALQKFPQAGERFLYFSGARFDSCRIVRATSSAEAAVRRAAPAERWLDDDVSVFSGRM